MYYFIPAWYGQTDEFWKTAIDPWYRIRQKIEFDNSLHQVRSFQDEDLAPQLLLLAYQPHLRYFLHRHDVFMAQLAEDKFSAVSLYGRDVEIGDFFVPYLILFSDFTGKTAESGTEDDCWLRLGVHLSLQKGCCFLNLF